MGSENNRTKMLSLEHLSQTGNLDTILISCLCKIVLTSRFIENKSVNAKLCQKILKN